MDAHPLRNFCAGQLRHVHIAVAPVVVPRRPLLTTSESRPLPPVLISFIFCRLIALADDSGTFLSSICAVGIIPIENAPGLISAIATKRRSRLQIVAYTFLWFKWYISNGRVSIGVDGKGSGQRELTCCAKDDLLEILLGFGW